MTTYQYPSAFCSYGVHSIGDMENCCFEAKTMRPYLYINIIGTLLCVRYQALLEYYNNTKIAAKVFK